MADTKKHHDGPVSVNLLDEGVTGSGGVRVVGEEGVSTRGVGVGGDGLGNVDGESGGGVGVGDGVGGEGGGGGCGGGREDGGGMEELEKTLPFYLHVSGWLDASAHAAVMAFMTLPCRCDMYFRWCHMCNGCVCLRCYFFVSLLKKKK